MTRAIVCGIVLLGLILVGSGCAATTAGNQGLTQDNVSNIHKGVTTREQVVEILGQPDDIQLLADGRHVMFYQGMQGNSDFGQRIFQGVPIIGTIVPTTDTQTVRREFLEVYLNANNVVQDYQFSDNTSETKTTMSIFGGHAEETTTSNIPTTQRSPN
ncbi:MAG: hypothetical protein ABSB42_22145 [Tepidisphaeraceae bacterium]|jgi:hypothetical protein